MHMQYFFAFGNHPEISLAELQAVLERENINAKLVFNQNDIAIFDIKEILTLGFLKQLGGTVKFGPIIGQTTTSADLKTELLKYAPKFTEKFNFGISLYTGLNINVNHIGLSFKKEIKNTGGNCRFVVGKENPLSSVIVEKNKLFPPDGVEFVLIKQEKNVFIGQTAAVQDFEFYSEIDFGRPSRDDRSGMLPPKVSQIMVNLAGVSKDKIILDPFCGSGTVLQMAALLGYSKLLGNDNSEKAVNDTIENLTWLHDKDISPFTFEIFQGEAQQFSQLKNIFDFIVTEPFLGPPMHGNESPDRVTKVINELQALYHDFLSSIVNGLPKNGVIVMIIPEFHLPKGIQTLDMEQMLPDTLQCVNEWRYARENQHVQRRIVKLIKK